VYLLKSVGCRGAAKTIPLVVIYAVTVPRDCRLKKPVGSPFDPGIQVSRAGFVAIFASSMNFLRINPLVNGENASADEDIVAGTEHASCFVSDEQQRL